VVAVLVAFVLDAEVVNDQSEGDGTGVVSEEASSGRGEVIAGCCKVCDEAVLGKFASVREAVDAFADLCDC